MKYFMAFLLLSVFSKTILADIVLGVVPQQSPLKLLKVWSPVARYLSNATNENVKFKTEKSIPEFEKVLYSGGYDFAYMNPYHYVLAHKKQGYIAKVRANKNIRGILVVNKDSYSKDKDFKSKSYVFPAPNAFAATLVTKYELIKNFGVKLSDFDNSRYVNSHDSVYKFIAKGLGDIGGGIERTFNNFGDKEAKEHLNIVYTTKAYPSHPFAFKNSMDKEIQKKLVDALLNMPDELLKSLSMKKLKKIEDTEYDSVKDLSIKLKLIKE
jgi:phosphonate transport system substrate-binding protein